MGNLMPFVPRGTGTATTGRCKMHRNLARDMPDRIHVPVATMISPGDITRRHERIARVLDRARGLLDDAERETDRLRIRVLQHAAGCLVAFAQEIAGNTDDPLIHGVH